MAHSNAFQARILLLNRLDLLNDPVGRSRQEGAGLDGSLDRGQAGIGSAARIADVANLLVGQAAAEPQRAEHLEILLEEPLGLLHRLLDAGSKVEVEADADAFTRLWVLVTGPDHCVPVAVDDAVHGAALGHASSNDALYAVLDHEVQRPLRAALDWLPALDGQLARAGHQGKLLQRVAAIGHFRRQGVVLALVRPGLFVERLEDDFHLLFKQLPVGVLVLQGRTEALDLAGVVAATHAEYDAPAGQDVGGGVVFGQTQRVPHRSDVEAAAKLEVLGHVG